jgi:polyferredoxin
LTGDLMTKIAASSFILLVASVGITILFRRAFCGQLCPLGALQGAAAGAGKQLFGKKFRLPSAADKPLRWLKYVVLAAVTGLTWVAGTLVIRPYDPWVAFMHLSSTELWSGFWVGTLILIGSLVASLFFDRFFCKYLCPMGALYGLVSKLGLYRVRRDESKCIDCGKCDKVCPVDLPVSKGKDVTSAECLACGLCVNECPAQGALAIAGPKNSNISPLFLTLATVAVFTAVVVVTAIPGWFELSKRSLGEEVKASQKTEQVEAAPAGTKFDPDLIRGRNTFAEIVDQTGIPRKAFEEKFQVSEEALDRPIKESTADGAFTMGDVRNFVAEKLGITGYASTEK